MISGCTWVTRVLFALGLFLAGAVAQAATPLTLLQQLEDYPHSRQISFAEEEVIDYEIGLGAMQKLGGAWGFKHSDRFSGALTSYTWQIVDGFTSLEVMAELVSQVEKLEGAKLLFSCEGRACGGGVQWANRVFHQPVLYGREELQQYRVYSSGVDPVMISVIYAAARTADRQYLHAETLEVTP